MTPADRVQQVKEAQDRVECLVERLVEIARLHRRPQKKDPALDGVIVDAIADASSARDLLADLLEDAERLAGTVKP